MTVGDSPGSLLVQLTPVLPLGLAEEIGRRILFVSADITRFDIVSDGDWVTGVTVYSHEPMDLPVVTRKINAVVDTEVRPQLLTPAARVWTSATDRLPAGDIFDELVAVGAVTEAAEGQVVVGEPLLSLFYFLDATLVRILSGLFPVREYRYPTLIPTAALQSAGYLNAFPQHLFVVTRLHNDLDVYHSAQQKYGDSAIDSGLLEYCQNVDSCLPPTMCYHTFHQHRGRTLGAEGLTVVTARGKSFRFEAGYATTLERLWDFTIREMVFLGTREDVLAAREQVMTAIFELLDSWGLTGYCEVGNDPFFGGEDAPDRIWSQRMMRLKYELRLVVAPHRSIAVGSFNFHNDLFGQSFEIQHNDGGPVWSGCVGFGLERLAYALLTQFGIDPAGWPDAVRAGSKSGVR